MRGGFAKGMVFGGIVGAMMSMVINHDIDVNRTINAYVQKHFQNQRSRYYSRNDELTDASKIFLETFSHIPVYLKRYITKWLKFQ